MAEQLRSFAVAGGGERLDKSVAAVLGDLSRTHIQRLIEDGFVEVDGRVVTKPAFRIEAPAALQVRVPPPAPSSNRPEAIPLDIVFENDDLLVVNKPAGLVVHPAAGHFAGTLVNAVLAHVPNLEGVGDEARPGIVHRLDKDTSGLIVVAKNSATHRDLQRQFKDRSVEKQYLALLDGHLPSATGRIEAAIGRDPRNRKRMAIVSESQGRPAVTEYRVRAEYAEHTLVEAQLFTGRTHQLRLHFAYMRCPIVGDTVYGRRAPSLPLKRQFLHAARLSFDLPGGGQRMTFVAPLPDDLAAVLPQLPAREIGADKPGGVPGRPGARQR